MADERTYIRVHDGIEDHPKIVALSDKAFRVLVTTWGWCSKHRTDGRIPMAVWTKRGTAKVRAELVAAGLVEIVDGRVVMHDYLEHQRSAEVIAEKVAAKRRAGALGNHNRWHVGKKHDPECPICIANGSQVRSQTGSQNGSQRDRETSPETETETELVETLRGEGHLSNARGARPADRCSAHTLDTNPPPCGACADARRARERWDTTAELQRRRCPHCDRDGWRWHPDGKRHGVIGQRCDHQTPTHIEAS